jgi:hypothetical protein
MKRSRSYPQVMRRWYRPVEHKCAECGRTLREVKTLSKRIVVTLAGVIKVTHAGYRCLDAQCPGYQRTYRSVAADALALPGFTYGLDIVLLVWWGGCIWASIRRWMKCTRRFWSASRPWE